MRRHGQRTLHSRQRRRSQQDGAGGRGHEVSTLGTSILTPTAMFIFGSSCQAEVTTSLLMRTILLLSNCSSCPLYYYAQITPLSRIYSALDTVKLSPLTTTSQSAELVATTCLYSSISFIETLNPPHATKITVAGLSVCGTTFLNNDGLYAGASVAAHASSANILWSSSVQVSIEHHSAHNN